MDYGGKADPYLKFDLGGVKIKTTTHSDTVRPVFNEVLYLPSIYPSMVQTLRMSFKDYDPLNKNDYIGSYHFKISDIENGKFKHPQWTYLYGGYDKGNKENALLMN